MRRVAASAVALGLLTGAAPVHFPPHGDWTPHSVGQLLDESFPSLEACTMALADARERESHAKAVRGMSYRHLFEQGRCKAYEQHGRSDFRIRMHWKPRTAPISSPPHPAEPAPDLQKPPATVPGSR